MALTKVAPYVIAVSNNVTSTTIGGAGQIPSLTFDGSGIITAASNTALTVANTAITGNIISSQISANLTLYGNTTITGNLVSSGGAKLSLPNTTSTLGYINIPAVGQKSAAYTLSTLDVGKFVEQSNANGTITIPNTTFSSGDAVSIFNNTNTTLTITCSAVTAWAAGNNTSKTSINVSTRGVASVLFISSNVCVVTGTLAS